MSRRLILALVCLPAIAHHSNIGFEARVLTARGTVKEFQWMNPHTWIYVQIDREQWAFEGRAPRALMRSGWSKDSLHAGDVVTIRYYPAKDGTKTGMVDLVTRQDGTLLRNEPAK